MKYFGVKNILFNMKKKLKILLEMPMNQTSIILENRRNIYLRTDHN